MYFPAYTRHVGYIDMEMGGAINVDVDISSAQTTPTRHAFRFFFFFFCLGDHCPQYTEQLNKTSQGNMVYFKSSSKVLCIGCSITTHPSHTEADIHFLCPFSVGVCLPRVGSPPYNSSSSSREGTKITLHQELGTQ